MKKFLFLFILAFAAQLNIQAQDSGDLLVSKCIASTGQTSRYLKDFIIKLGSDPSGPGFRYKAELVLRKRTKYRFTMCTNESTGGQLIFSLKDPKNQSVASSVDPKTGNISRNVDFLCKKSGKYQISYDFSDGKAGSGVGVVSLIE